jgi:hypothetical protein
MTDLNLVGESYAHSLVSAGKIDKTSSWSFEAADGNALLGKGGDDWENYSRHHLGLDRSANDKTKARYRYPFAKADRLYRSGLIAARQRAGQQGDGAVERAASSLIDIIDKPKSSTGRAVFEYKFVDEQASPGTFEGYGSVFNNEDDGGDLIQPGAFAGVIQRHKAKGSMPKMLLNQHGWQLLRWERSDGGPADRLLGHDERGHPRAAMQGTAHQSRHRDRQAHLWRDEGTRARRPLDRLLGRRV